MTKYRLLIAVVVQVFIGFALHFGSGYTIEKPVSVTVVDKIIMAGRYSGHPEMVLRLDDGFTFDTIVSTETYSQCDIGERYTMQLAPMNIRQTVWQNILFFFAPVMFWASAFAMPVARLFGLTLNHPGAENAGTRLTARGNS